MSDSGKHLPEEFRCGYVTIVGRPNVGKSTLLNRIIGQKISITSGKPQTTRWCLYGIRSKPHYQVIFVDTPGLQTRYRDSLNRHMVREIRKAIEQVHVVLMMVEALGWNTMDEQVLGLLGKVNVPVLLLINKIDRLQDRGQLLPFIKQLSGKSKFNDIIPVSATRNENIDAVESAVVALLPVAPPEYPIDQLSDRNERFFAAEFIREKLIRQLGEELPYRIAVTIERFERQPRIIYVDAVIWVEGESQKRIIIGKGGLMLKAAGEKARKDMESMFGCKLYLQTWVKIRKNWTGDARAMKEFGYEQ